MNDMNTTTKPGVLAVMEEARALAADQRDMHDDNNNTPMADSWESFRADVVAARATVERLADKADNVMRILSNAIAAGAVGVGYQQHVNELRTELAAFRGDA